MPHAPTPFFLFDGVVLNSAPAGITTEPRKAKVQRVFFCDFLDFVLNISRLLFDYSWILFFSGSVNLPHSYPGIPT